MLMVLSILYFLYQFVVRIFFGLMMEDIESIYFIGTDTIGLIAGIYYTGYAISNICTAILYTQFNFIKVTIFGSCCIILGQIPFVIDSSSYLLIFGRFLTGIGSGMALPFLIQTIVSTYSLEYHKLLINTNFMLVMIMLSISIYIIFPLYNISFNYFELSNFLLFLGLVLFALLLSVFYTSSDTAKDKNESNIDISEVYSFIFNKKILVLGVIGGLFVGVLEGFADLWAPFIFQDVFNIENAGMTICCFWISLAFGGFILQYLFQMTNTTGIVFLMHIGAMKILIFILLLVNMYIGSNMGLLSACLIMIALAVLSGYQFFIFGEVPNIVGSRYNVIGVALVNAINMFFGQFFHVVIAGIINAYGKNTTGYMLGMLPICICILIGLVLCFLYKDYIYSKEAN